MATTFFKGGHITIGKDTFEITDVMATIIDPGELRTISQPKLWKVAFTRDGLTMVEKPDGTWSNEDDRSSMKRKYNLIDPSSTFIGRLRIEDWEVTATNSYHVYWLDMDTGIRYPSFFRSAMYALSSANLSDGVLTGQWGYEKKGPRQGIRLLEELDV